MDDLRGRNRRSAVPSVLTVATCLAVAVVQVPFGDVAPVGEPAANLVWTGLLAGAAGLAVPRAPSVLVLSCAFVLLGFVYEPLGIASALIATALCLVSIRRSSWTSPMLERDCTDSALARSALPAITAGALLIASFSLQDHGVRFLSAWIAGALWAAVIGGAFALASRRVRRTSAAMAAALTVLGLVVGVAAARDLRAVYGSAVDAEISMQETLEAARSGDLAKAESAMAATVQAFEGMTERLDSPQIHVLRYLPIAGPNLDAADSVLAPVGDVLSSTEAAVKQGRRFDRMIDAQRIEVSEVEALATHAETAVANIHTLHETLTDDRSVWVIDRLNDRLAAVEQQLAPITQTPELELVDAATQMLGSETSRSYLLLFGNTAEARELGGFTGGTAVLRIDDGEISLARAERPDVTNRSSASASAFTTAVPQRFLAHYPWLYAQNYTAMADFPTLARALGDLYPAMGGPEIDGVIYIDSQALGALVGLIGDVRLDTWDMTIAPDEVARVINVGQYAFDFESREDREDFLSDLVAEIFRGFLSDDVDIDTTKMGAVVHAIRQDRLLVVPFDEDEYVAMDALGLVGGVEVTPGADYLAVSHLNGGPNKLDAYTKRDVSYTVTVDPDTGDLDAVVEVTLYNHAPVGLPEYADENIHGYPPGTNRAFIVVHTPHDLVEWVGGEDEPELARSWQEFGLQRHEHVVAVARGESRTISLRLRGRVDPGDYTLDLAHQPLVHNDNIEFVLEPTHGAYSSNDPRTAVTQEQLLAEFELALDTSVEATWSPQGATRLAKAVGGG